MSMDPLTEKLLDMSMDSELETFRITDDLVECRENLKRLFVYEPNLQKIREALGGTDNERNRVNEI